MSWNRTKLDTGFKFMEYTATLKSPFGKKIKAQNVVLWIEEKEPVTDSKDTTQDDAQRFFSIWFALRRKNSKYLLVVRLLTQVKNDITTLLKKFAEPTELTMNDSELEQAVLKEPMVQYWYVDLDANPGSRVPAAIQDYVSSAVSLIKLKETKPIGFFDYNSVTNITFIAHLSYDIYSQFFIQNTEDLIIDAPYFILQNNNLTAIDGEDYKWRPEDAPSDYSALIKQLLKAEALKSMGNRLGSFNVRLPFSYGNIFKGGTVIFYKQKDLFSGVVTENSLNSDSQGKGSTNATVSRITSFKDAIRLTSIEPCKLWDNSSIALGFDFVDPISVETTDVYARFDWRRCAYLNISGIAIPNDKLKSIQKLQERGVNIVPLPVFRTKKEDIRLLRRIEKADISLLFTQDGTIYEEKLTAGFEKMLRGNYKVAAQADVTLADRKEFLSMFSSLSEWLEYIVFDPYLYELEVNRCYAYNLILKFENLGNLTVGEYYKLVMRFQYNKEVISDLRTELENTTDPTAEKELNRALTEALYEQELLVVAWENMVTVEPAAGAGRLDWIKNIIPVCSGVSEVEYASYADLLCPKKIFSKEIASLAARDTVNLSSITFPTLEPLLGTDLKLGGTGSRITKLINFIQTVRDNIVPYASEHTFKVGSLTLDHRRSDNG